MFSRIRTTCSAALAVPGCPVHLGPASAFTAFLQGPYAALSSHAASKGAGIDLPLVLDTDEGIDATVLLCLLQFGSGFRLPLHQAVQCGASDTMIRGVLGFLMVGRKPSAGLLAHLREHEVAEIFSLPMTVDEPVPDLPCVTIAKPGPLRPLIAHITRALNSCGKVLLEAEAATFAAYLRANAAAWTVEGKPSLEAFVAFLAERFPVAFRDMATVPEGSASSSSSSSSSAEASGGTELEVWFLKKAQLCAKELGRKFGAVAPELFGWAAGASGAAGASQALPATAALTAFADNVLPCVLRAEGLLVVSAELGARIESLQEVSRSEAAWLRAGTVAACDALAAESGVSAEELDNVLWHGGKVPAYRALPRHIDTQTLYY